jgi:hypothetical protein
MSDVDSIMTKFKSELSKSLIDSNVDSSSSSKIKNEFKESEKSYKPLTFLKKGSSMSEILDLVKNKKFSNNKIKSEIRKHLNDSEQLEEFLNSILDSRTKKKESKEATSAGGGVGAFEGPLFSKKETKEATSTASSGAYETPKMWAKSTSKKDWRGKAKTQIPGGKFVQVKKKCKRFPYCNQGDIKALNLSENEDIQIAIQNVSKKYGLSEDKIIDIILREANTNKK